MPFFQKSMSPEYTEVKSGNKQIACKVLEIKGLVLHRVCRHLKVTGCLSDVNAILTKTLPMYLSRLN